MLKTPIFIQANIPNRLGGNIRLLMQALKTQSERILIRKTISANKAISKLLSTWLYEMIDHSTAAQKKEIIATIGQRSLQHYPPRTTHNWEIQEIDTKCFQFLGIPCNNQLCWVDWLHQKILNSVARQIYLDHISPSTPIAADIQKQKNICKFYWWCWGCRQEDKNTYDWCMSHECVPYHTGICIPP